MPCYCLHGAVPLEVRRQLGARQQVGHHADDDL
jgi:hypothetical protein